MDWANPQRLRMCKNLTDFFSSSVNRIRLFLVNSRFLTTRTYWRKNWHDQSRREQRSTHRRAGFIIVDDDEVVVIQHVRAHDRSETEQRIAVGDSNPPKRNIQAKLGEKTITLKHFDFLVGLISRDPPRMAYSYLSCLSDSAHSGC